MSNPRFILRPSSDRGAANKDKLARSLPPWRALPVRAAMFLHGSTTRNERARRGVTDDAADRSVRARMSRDTTAAVEAECVLSLNRI